MSPPPPWLVGLADRCADLTALDLTRLTPPDDGSARDSAVLLLFGEGPDGPDVLLTARAASLRSHAGQVAFPGGGRDEGDEFPVGTALREAVEETGLDPGGVAVLGTLPTLWVPRSNFAVAPVLGWWHTPTTVAVQDPRETAAVARVPLRTLADPAVRASVELSSGWRSPAFVLPDLFVWGFTAGLLDRLLDLAGFARPWDADRVVPLPREVAGLPRT